MNASYKEAIRKLLIEHPDGLTAESIGNRLNIRPSVARRCISLSMPDCYLDRWTEPVRGQYQAVYCRGNIPEDAPHPKDRFIETQWRTRSIAAMERIAA